MNILSQTRFQEPSNWQFETFTRNNRTIRFGYTIPDNPKAVVILCPGLGEYCEKYYETARFFLENNLAVFAIDWMGQGKSGRLLDNPLKRHGTDFLEDAADLHTLITNHIQTKMNTPICLFAHSMGGNIALRYLQNFDHNIAFAFFSAPMCGIKDVTYLPDPILMMATSWLNMVCGQNFTTGHGEYAKMQRRQFENNILSSDPERFELHHAWWDHDPDLRIGDVTYGWVYHAVRSCHAAFKDAKKIKIPCLFALAGQEKIVDNSATEKVVSLIKTADIITYPDAQHELIMEQDSVRNDLLTRFLELIEKTIQT